MVFHNFTANCRKPSHCGGVSVSAHQPRVNSPAYILRMDVADDLHNDGIGCTIRGDRSTYECEGKQDNSVGLALCVPMALLL